MRIRYPQTFIATTLLVAMACGPLAASVDSLQVTTSVWKRSSAEATFSPGQARLTLVFEKEMPAREPAAADEFEYSEDGPKLTAEVSYGKSAAKALAGNVAGLEGVFTSSAWLEEDDTTQPTGDFAPDRPMARKKVLRAALGNALYRVWAPPAAGRHRSGAEGAGDWRPGALPHAAPVSGRDRGGRRQAVGGAVQE